MKKLWVVALLGALIGAGLVQAIHTVRDRQRASDRLFEQRLRCKDLAEAYVNKESNKSDVLETAVGLERVDFSSSRNSCIASTFGGEYSRSRTVLDYQVVDVISQEILYSGSCNNTDQRASTFCGGGKNMKLMEERDKVFEETVKR
jgi:hypothetical protein